MKVALLLSLLFWIGIGFLLKATTGSFHFSDLLFVMGGITLISILLFVAHFLPDEKNKNI